MKKMLLLAALTLGIASIVSADIPWPVCDPCPSVTAAR
jgi:hypothetical protein